MAVQDRFSLRNIYLYLVCLISLVIAIFAAVSLVRSTVELLYPDPGYYGGPIEYGKTGEQLSSEERERMEQQARDSQRRQAVLGLVGSGTTLAITGPLYVYHWRRVQKELPKPAQPTTGEPPTS